MARISDQKLKILYVLKIFMEETDENHPISIKELEEKLLDYGVTSERKSLYDDIAQLRLFGIKIEMKRLKSYCYYLVGRTFEVPELKLLVDSVQCSKFITPRKTHILIKKLESLTNKYDGAALHRQVYVTNRVKTMNESIYSNTDIIHTAISSDKMIKFKYYEWQLNFGAVGSVKKVMKKHGDFYTVSPWHLTWNDENYYLVASDGHKLKHFRVDKMAYLSVLEGERRDREEYESLDIAEYVKENFGMYSGDSQEVVISFPNELIGVVVDRFGSNLDIKKMDEEKFFVAIKVAVSPTFIGWIFSFGDKAKVISPESVTKRLKEHTSKIADLYK